MKVYKRRAREKEKEAETTRHVCWGVLGWQVGYRKGVSQSVCQRETERERDRETEKNIFTYYTQSSQFCNTYRSNNTL